MINICAFLVTTINIHSFLITMIAHMLLLLLQTLHASYYSCSVMPWRQELRTAWVWYVTWLLLDHPTRCQQEASELRYAV